MQKTDLLAAWFQHVWVNGNTDAIDQFFDADTQADGFFQDLRVGADDFKVLVEAMLNLLSEPGFEIVQAVEDGDWLAAVIQTWATDRRTGARVTNPGQIMVRFSGMKIAEAYNTFDFVHLFEQMELLPADTMALCMAGEPIA